MGIQRILEDLRNTKYTGNQISKEESTKVFKNDKGECITCRKGIANVFGGILQKTLRRQWARWIKTRIWWRRKQKQHWSAQQQHRRDDKITTEGLQTAINKLKKGKTPDGKGIRAEDIKACDDETREIVRQIFNEILKRNGFTPEDWKKVTIKAIHKKGAVQNMSNYRPICSLPALHKLFSTILYGRITPSARPETSGRSGRL